MNWLPMRRSIAAVAVVLVVGTACGGSGVPTEAEDEAAARRMVLTAADAPGFVEEPQADDDGPGPIDRCVNDNPLLVGENPRGVDGPDLTKDDGDLRVQSGALLGVKEADAARAFSDLEGALTSQCLKDAMRETFAGGTGPGVVVRDVAIAPLAAPGGAEQAAASRVTVGLERGRERASVYVDLTVLRRDRAVAGVFTFAMGQPFPDTERARLTTLVAERMGNQG